MFLSVYTYPGSTNPRDHVHVIRFHVSFRCRILNLYVVPMVMMVDMMGTKNCWCDPNYRSMIVRGVIFFDVSAVIINDPNANAFGVVTLSQRVFEYSDVIHTMHKVSS